MEEVDLETTVETWPQVSPTRNYLPQILVGNKPFPELQYSLERQRLELDPVSIGRWCFPGQVTWRGGQVICGLIFHCQFLTVYP